MRNGFSVVLLKGEVLKMKHVLLNASLAFLILVAVNPFDAFGTGIISKEKEPSIQKKCLAKQMGNRYMNTP